MLIQERYWLTGKPYPKRLIFKVVGYSSSTWYEHPTPRTGKRGRKPRHTDDKVLQEIKVEIGNSKFNAEGYMKVKKRMEKRETNTLVAGKERVNRFVAAMEPLRSAECNGIIERFHRTLEEQVLQIQTFSSFEEAYNTINQFIKNYNTNWILHRLNYCSPIEYRGKYAQSLRKVKDIFPSGNKEPEGQLVRISSGSMPRRNEKINWATKKGVITFSKTPLINPSVKHVTIGSACPVQI